MITYQIADLSFTPRHPLSCNLGQVHPKDRRDLPAQNFLGLVSGKSSRPYFLRDHACIRLVELGVEKKVGESVPDRSAPIYLFTTVHLSSKT